VELDPIKLCFFLSIGFYPKRLFCSLAELATIKTAKIVIIEVLYNKDKLIPFGSGNSHTPELILVILLS
jgi:hypothetical protein